MTRRTLRAQLLCALTVVAMLAIAVPAAGADKPQHRAAGAASQLGAAMQQLTTWRHAQVGYASDDYGTAAPGRLSWLEADQTEAVPGVLLVTTTDRSAADSVRRFASTTRSAAFASAQVAAPATRVLRVEVEVGKEAEAAAELAARPGVVAVERAGFNSFERIPNDPLFDLQWQHVQSRTTEAWDVTTGSTDVRLAVIDSGVDARHPDLAGQVVSQWMAATGEVVPGTVDNDPCQDGHGTAVAGVAGAAGDNNEGIAGVAWAVSIIDVAISHPDVACGGGPDDAIIAGIAGAVADGADVINLSLGRPASACPTAMQAALDEAIAAGVVVVAAAGNHEQALPGVPSVPASCNGVISVGGSTAVGTHSPFSATNAWIDVAAGAGDGSGTPEGDVATTARDGAYAAVAGTSFASPYVAGVAALLRSIDGTISPAHVRGALQATAIDAGEPGFDVAFGWGITDAAAAVAAVAAGQRVDPAPQDPFPVGDRNLPRPGGPAEVGRLGTVTAPTTAIDQAVAVSQTVFADNGALWGVLARDDVYADALAGSTLALGVAPVLFSGSTGALAPQTAAELQRALPPGATVYILGGSAALPVTVEAEIQALGLNPIRVAGAVREHTAAAVADHVVAILQQELGVSPDAVVIANRNNWPDAVNAGSIGVQLGVPILLTAEDSLHPATAAAIERIAPDAVITVGGVGVVSADTELQAAAVADIDPAAVIRLHGPTRVETALDVSTFVETLFWNAFGAPPPWALAVNVRRADGYAHFLSSTPFLVIGGGGIYLPIEGEDGTVINNAVRDYARGLGIDGALVGGPDLVSDAAAFELRALLRGE